jgi:hypothetical protein
MAVASIAIEATVRASRRSRRSSGTRATTSNNTSPLSNADLISSCSRPIWVAEDWANNVVLLAILKPYRP